MRRFDRLGRLAPIAPALALACASGTAIRTGDTTRGMVLDATPAEQRAADRHGPDPDVFGGLWTFESPPRAQWEARWGDVPDNDWLMRARASTARVGEYCSGAVVSPDGLILTTQSCVLECITATTPAGRDDVARGIHARSAGEERLCPGLYIDLLEDVDDVTATVETAMMRSPETSREQARSAAIARIEQECGAEPGRVCQVAELWNGARLHRYAYRRLTAVKLVFAPEMQAASAGGGADHLAWPRYALDFALLRGYERNGREAAHTPAYLTLRTAALDDEHPVLVVGSPITSQRLATTSQLVYERDVRLPQNRHLLNGLAHVFAGVDDDMEARRAVRAQLYNVRGSLDQVQIQLDALADSLIVGARIAWEREVRRIVAADAELGRRYGDLWDRMAAIQAEKAALGPRLNAANVRIIGVPHFIYGIDLGRYTRALALPESERPRELRGIPGEEISAFLQDESYIDEDLARRFLAVYLSVVETWLDPDDPLRTGLLYDGESPDAAAERLAAGSRLLDPAWRTGVLRGGPVALADQSDPLLHHAMRMDSMYPVFLPRFQDLLLRESRERRRLGQATLITFGESIAPDASFSPRIADGVVRGYRQGYDMLPAQTSFHGLFERDRAFADRPGWTLPASFRERRAHVDMSTPLTFIVTADAFGSGSAVLDRDGHLAGLITGTNAPHVANRAAFLGRDGRAVAVHAGAIVEALSAVYRADRMVKSMKIAKDDE